MQETLFGTLQKKQDNMKMGKKGNRLLNLVIVCGAYVVIRFLINFI